MEDYHIHISSKHKWFDLKLDEIYQYKELIILFTKKNFVTTYKQTILGPLWIIINPLLSSFIYMFVFGEIAKLSTNGTPKLLFYLTSTAFWTYFSSNVTKSADTFIENAHLFGKVYFPRLTVSIAKVIVAVIKLMIQLSLVLVLIFYYQYHQMVLPNYCYFILLPFIVIQLGLLSLASGIIISSLTTKYRDLNVLVTMGIQLWMYASPIVYPLSQLSKGTIKTLVLLNPVTQPIELIRYILLGSGEIYIPYYLLSILVTVVLFITGIILFNKVERTFMDTI